MKRGADEPVDAVTAGRVALRSHEGARELTSAKGSVKKNTESMRLVCRLYDWGTADLIMRSHAPYLPPETIHEPGKEQG